MANDTELLIKIKALDELTPVMLKAMQSMDASASKLAESINKVNAPTDKLTGSTGGLNTGVINLAAGMGVVKMAAEAVGAAFGVLSDFVGKAIEESLAAEQASNRLQGALISTGQYTAELSEHLNKYAEDLEATVGANGDLVRSQIATGVQMGLTAEKAKEMELAARKLAAATGTDVNEAFSKLQGALAGNARGLGMVLPQIKELSAAQLKNGDAIAIVNKALEAQYEIYKTSFAGSLERAKVGVDNIYKAFGEVITQNPAVKAALSGFADMIFTLTKFLDDNKGTMKEWVTDGVLFMIDSLEALNLGFDTIYRVGKASFEGIMGAVHALDLGITTLIGGPVALLEKGLSVLPGVGGQFGAAADAIVAHAEEVSDQVNAAGNAVADAFAKPTAGSTMFENALLKVRDAAVSATAAEKDNNKALQESAEASSKAAAAALNLHKSYGGIDIGTQKQREALVKESSDRDENLKDYKTYLDNKTRLSVTQAQEEAMEVNKAKAAALKGSGGAGEKAATGDVEADAETKKQAALKAQREQGLISENDYQEARLASEQRYAAVRLQQSQANELALAEAMGDTEEAYQEKQALEDERFQLELQQMDERAQQRGATTEQINAMNEQQLMEHQARMNQNSQAYYDNQASQEEAAGNHFQAYLDRVKSAQIKHGAVIGAAIVTVNSEQYKAVQQGLSNLSTLMSTKSRALFAIGKAAAIANAVVGTAQAVVNALAVPPFPLGLALSITAGVAGAVQIAKIASTEFGGGQADEGMDSVPAGLGGKSFILSQGERVVQPEANKDLIAFLAKQKNNDDGRVGGGGNNYSITLNYAGTASQTDARLLATDIVKEIRAMSERGTPIMSKKGLSD